MIWSAVRSRSVEAPTRELSMAGKSKAIVGMPAVPPVAFAAALLAAPGTNEHGSVRLAVLHVRQDGPRHLRLYTREVGAGSCKRLLNLINEHDNAGRITSKHCVLSVSLRGGSKGLFKLLQKPCAASVSAFLSCSV